MTLHVGEGLRGNNSARSTLCRISVTPAATHNQIGPLWCWFPSEWACACPQPPWISPTTSSVRLGVSPSAAPTPRGVFNQRFEALFPCAGALGYAVGLAPRRWSGFIYARMWGHQCYRHSACPVLHHSESRPLSYLCANVGPQGLLVVGLPALFVPHSASLGPATATQVLSAPPTRLDECLFFIPWCRTFLLFDILSVLVV